MNSNNLNETKKSKSIFDFNQKPRHVVDGSKDQSLVCLAEILVDAYLNKKRDEKAKQPTK